ncbi:glycosyl transferase family 1 [Halarchaeum grantii]|uniref:Glycosyl transferase family 1 n=1 Tax=Halarchaeum grantii TaxID=1193105 RepID=A0A830EW04_9EURY|nr:glycosyltransferase family 4 protein [Halarchaeum grantii]GGL30284.1 glycosyl transferase family 1 [Halarchaeum grantii]
MRTLDYLEFEDRLRGGIVTATRQQRKALRRQGVDVAESPWRAGDPVRSLGTAFAGLGYFDDYDVAHCNTIGPGSLAVARHAKREDVPLVLHAHTTGEDFAGSFRYSERAVPALKAYLKRFYAQADVVLCPSDYTRSVLESYPVDAPIRTVSNGVDVESLEGYESFREETRERFDLEGMVVFSVGEVFERKGLSTFCRLAERTDYDFAWFGHYETGAAASAEVTKWTQNPPENVTFTGFVEDKRMAFGAGDVYCFPTKNENQGIAVLEAMATGKPVVLRDIPVFEEFFEDGHDCLKCETEAEFRDALERLAAEPELRERLGANARETANEHSLARVGERLTDVYRALLNGEVPPESTEPMDG